MLLEPPAVERRAVAHELALACEQSSSLLGRERALGEEHARQRSGDDGVLVPAP